MFSYTMIFIFSFCIIIRKLTSVAFITHTIYEEALPLLKTDPYYLYFMTIMTDIMLEIAMFKTRQEFEEDIASIVSRLDSLENELKLIKRNSGQ